HVLGPETVSRRKPGQVKFDARPSALGFDFGPAARIGQQGSSTEADLCLAIAMKVVDGGNIARDHFNLVEGLPIIELHGSLRIGLPLGWVCFLGAQPAGCGHQPGGGQEQNQGTALTMAVCHLVHLWWNVSGVLPFAPCATHPAANTARLPRRWMPCPRSKLFSRQSRSRRAKCVPGLIEK